MSNFIGPCPDIPKALVEFLETIYPEKCPSPQQSDRDIWRMVGNREVVRKLRLEYEYQQQNEETPG